MITLNKISDVTKILLMAATIIITCIIVALGMSVAKNSEKLGQSANKQISDLDKQISESGLMAFDKTVVNGNEVVNLIKEQLGEYEHPSISPISIDVDGYSHTNNLHIADLRNFDLDNPYYIKPTGKFYGQVERNDNRMINRIIFTQQ